MDYSKKAKKLTKLIATQLKDAFEDGCEKEKMEKSFKEAVRGLKKKEIRSEIESNIKKYFKTFEKFLKVARHEEDDSRVDEPFSINLYQFENQDTVEVNAKNSEIQQKIVNHLIAEKLHAQPDLINLLEGLPSCSTEFPELSKYHLVLMLPGKTNSETLTSVLLQYFRAVQSLADKIFESQDLKRVEETAKEIKGFICVLHLKMQQCPKHEESRQLSYHDILASLLSVYTDLMVLSHRCDEEPKKAGKKLCGYLAYLLPWQHQLNLLLEVSQVTEKDKIIIPLVRTCLKWRPETKDKDVYLRFILATRSLHNIFCDKLDEVFETSKAIPAPKKFAAWLSHQDAELADEFPNDKKFKGTVVTQFLLKDITEDQAERLLDVLVTSTDTTEDQTSENQVVTEDQQTVIGQVSTGSSLGDQLFFIDKGNKETLGGTEKFYIDKGRVGGGRDSKAEEDSGDESEADSAMETVINNDDDEKMEAELYTIDTGIYNREDKENVQVGNNLRIDETSFVSDVDPEKQETRKHRKSLLIAETKESFVSDSENEPERRRSTRKSIKVVPDEKLTETTMDIESVHKPRRSVASTGSVKDSKKVDKKSEQESEVEIISKKHTRRSIKLDGNKAAHGISGTEVVSESELKTPKSGKYSVKTVESDSGNGKDSKRNRKNSETLNNKEIDKIIGIDKSTAHDQMEELNNSVENESVVKSSLSLVFEEKSPPIKTYANYSKLRKRKDSSKSDCDENLDHDMDYSMVIGYQGNAKPSEEIDDEENLQKADVIVERKGHSSRRRSKRISECSESNDKEADVSGKSNYNPDTPRSLKRKSRGSEPNTPALNMDQSKNSQPNILSPVKEHVAESKAKTRDSCQELLNSPSSPKKKRRKEAWNADDLVVPDSHGESDEEEAEVLPDITKYSKHKLNSGSVNVDHEKRKVKTKTPSSARKVKDIYELHDDDGGSEAERTGEKYDKTKICVVKKDKQSTPQKRSEDERETPKVLRKTRNSTGMTLRSRRV